MSDFGSDEPIEITVAVFHGGSSLTDKQTVVKKMMLRYFLEAGIEEIEKALKSRGEEGGDLSDRTVRSYADFSVVITLSIAVS